MNRVKPIILVVLFLGICQFNLFSLITSRVEGTVVDKDTGAPIEGVKVVLRLRSGKLGDLVGETMTNKKGYFKFDDIRGNYEYYLLCFKKGYIPFLPEYYRQWIKDEYFEEIYRVFKLDEGQIKHIKIKMEKGGILKARFYKKEASGVSIYKNISFSLERKREPNEVFFIDLDTFFVLSVEIDNIGDIAPTVFIHPNKTGEFEIKGFTVEVTQPGEYVVYGLEPLYDYNITFSEDGYRIPVIRDISIEKNEVTNIEYTVDLTNKTGIQGGITISGIPPRDGSIALDSLDPDTPDLYWSCRSELDKDGKYSCLGLLPGKYKMEIYVIAQSPPDHDIRKDIIVEIEEGKTKILNLNY